MYHGFGEVDIDPWGLYVSPKNFAAHLEVYAARTEVVRLTELVSRARLPSGKSLGLALTIDDGYANVLHLAKPILRDHNMPATVFVISEPVRSGREYWWDELAQILLRPGRLPPTLELAGNAGPVSFDLGPSAHYLQSDWRADHRYREGDRRASDRMHLYLRLWQYLLDLDHLERQNALSEIADWAAVVLASRATHRSLTETELVELDQGQLVNIGGHTMTHPLLPKLSASDQAEEVEGNKRHLEAVLGHPITSFAYPFGGHDALSVGVVQNAAYPVAVTGRQQTVSPGSDAHMTPRFDVKNWDADELDRRLTRWLRFL